MFQFSPELFERFEQQTRERLAAVVEDIRERNKEKDPNDVYRDVTAVVEEVRYTGSRTQKEQEW